VGLGAGEGQAEERHVAGRRLDGGGHRACVDAHVGTPGVALLALMVRSWAPGRVGLVCMTMTSKREAGCVCERPNHRACDRSSTNAFNCCPMHKRHNLAVTFPGPPNGTRN